MTQLRKPRFNNFYIAIIINTPSEPLFIGESYNITWSVVGPEPTALGSISITTDLRSPSAVVNRDIAVNVNLTYHYQLWTVDIWAGYYFFGIKDGNTSAESGIFRINNGNSGINVTSLSTSTGSSVTPIT
ncbi:3239_t:CDS:1, partial [Acaulospora morrowiae]